MNLLIAAATPNEIAPLLQYLQQYRVDKQKSSYKKGTLTIKICITGIGCLAAAYILGKYLSDHTVDLAVQAGIAGAFSQEVPMGQVMRIKSDVLADLGAEDNEHFIDLFEMGFLKPDEPPYYQKRLSVTNIEIPLLKDLPEANAITVSTVSGRKSTIKRWKKKYHPILESMEGAAFHYICLMEKIPFVQIRSVSNYVEVRDKSQWNIPLAVKNLNKFLIQWLKDDTLLSQ